MVTSLGRVTFLDALREWFSSYSEIGGRREVQVEFDESPQDRGKRSVWIKVDGKSAMGQMTLWESGECNTDAVAKDGSTVLLLRERVLSSPMLVAAVADDLVDHVADYSRT